MPNHRTTSPNALTDLDNLVLDFCKEVAASLMSQINVPEAKADFKDKYAKISKTRDAGAGRGGGKLQRDALSTRGRTDKTPVSNRNFRWHPLVLAATIPSYAKPIERIEIQNTGGHKELVFVIRNLNFVELRFTSAQVYNLPDTFVALPEHWQVHNTEFATWTDTDWSNNRCAISAMEYCTWEDAFESYCALAVSAAVEVYDVDYDAATNAVQQIFIKVNETLNTSFPTDKFPKSQMDATQCPLCLKSYSTGLEDFRFANRLVNWQPTWAASKRSEGEDSSTQIMHVVPLSENVSNHNASNVRFGHRWCNVAMTDHSIDETVQFFEYITEKHEKAQQ
jgi:hypothetical protein